MLAFAIFAALMIVTGATLSWLYGRTQSDDESLVEQINQILPQTQCGQCDYPGCRPYAEAIAAGDAPINRCPPGGEQGIKALASLLDREALPLDPANGEEKPKATAFIIEETCIGCIKCIEACPVDAIVGAAQLMHTVITDECTGCELCVAPCPVDCIEMIEPTAAIDNWRPQPPRIRIESTP